MWKFNNNFYSNSTRIDVKIFEEFINKCLKNLNEFQKILCRKFKTFFVDFFCCKIAKRIYVKFYKSFCICFCYHSSRISVENLQIFLRKFLKKLYKNFLVNTTRISQEIPQEFQWKFYNSFLDFLKEFL